MEKEYTVHEVARHCTADDLWIIYNGNVYNMTPYFREHPGGTAMLRKAGMDASTALSQVPSHGIAWNFIQKKLGELCIGTIKH